MEKKITITYLADSNLIPSNDKNLLRDVNFEQKLKNDILKSNDSVEVNVSDVDKDSSDVSIQYIPCPGGGKHNMVPRGYGYVYVNGKEVVSRGQTSQCTKCNTVIISQYNPFFITTNKLGYYGNQGASEPVAQVTYMYTDRVYYNSNIADMDSYMWAGRG
ncbi:hypothetical protein ABET36_11990 [Caldifermentibacillus hisashii]|uniref:hypothetical protein n=1 Tax=Caldifermentibacillus hisashii TaxID=996558 RepID=UPI003D1A369A